MSMRRKRFKRCRRIGTKTSFEYFLRNYADWNLVGFRTMLITRSEDGYFGLRRSLSGVFGGTGPSAIRSELLLPRQRVRCGQIPVLVRLPSGPGDHETGQIQVQETMNPVRTIPRFTAWLWTRMVLIARINEHAEIFRNLHRCVGPEHS